MAKRVYRDRQNRMIAGVCSGLGEYFNVDPTLVRLAFVLLAFFHGLGILAYLLLWMITPYRAELEESRGQARD
ncbi:MAG: PspC domain-containing protein [Chloroflexota bacterium]